MFAMREKVAARQKSQRSYTVAGFNFNFVSGNKGYDRITVLTNNLVPRVSYHSN